MKNKKLKRLSLINLFTGYAMLLLFILLVYLNRAPEVVEVASIPQDTLYAEDLFNGVHEDDIEKEKFYVAGHPVERIKVIDRSIGRDHTRGVILDDEQDVVYSYDPHTYKPLSTRDKEFIKRNYNLIGGEFKNETHAEGHRVGHRDNINSVRDVHDISNGTNATIKGGFGERDIDSGFLDRRLMELENKDAVGVVDVDALSKAISEREEDAEKDFDIEAENLGNLTLARDNDLELGDINELKKMAENGYGPGEGELYAYNYPSQGVGAGIGSPAVGAGVGAAGLGAGIGEAVLNGGTVPALGGVGTYSPVSEGGPALAPPTAGGVAGLVSGAGAGGAAGLVSGRVKEPLGLGVGSGEGVGGSGGGVGGAGGYHWDHLPPEGALHIMMHVDGSGSILNTRKQLDIMKDTLLKEALLPYYNNDEELYSRRVTIVDGNGERTLQFFNEATKKDNVLALVFQDEAAPSYHLPTFNKVPQDDYSDDLKNLRVNLDSHRGLYRGIMFQVDRGRTFARSFKEFVECAWQGSGYLDKENLKKYYWEENKHHIKNKDGIVFSDVYHAKDEGAPKYYLDLIIESARRVGLDLNPK